ncbi:nucleotide exchange factor GrpE [Pontibacter beigongshangensis]|uniref:nucleotide exchange factor GrpE n=1 Tax=Pontibacter beigongshangensis TaxID=2574733 RepID=UPI00165018B7|nr:nucleotide exchange factor GrpE [Pontibacter beigongshangensis]
MSDKKNRKEQNPEELQDATANLEEIGQEQAEADEQSDLTAEAADTDTTAIELAEMKDKYIRLMAEFENFRRRTAKERIDLTKTATEDLMSNLLPVLDDMDRAKQALVEVHDVESALQGLDLVFHKLDGVLQQKGLKVIEIGVGSEFDSDFHEAVTQIPAPSEDLKGRIVDVIEKGYILNEKVIRFAKVIIGA